MQKSNFLKAMVKGFKEALGLTPLFSGGNGGTVRRGDLGGYLDGARMSDNPELTAHAPDDSDVFQEK